jgi:hypothetical protein
MPKILVLFDNRVEEMAALAETAARGAQAIRFAEVEVRHVGGLLPARAETASEHKQRPESPPGKYRGLESIEKLTDFDAVLFVAEGDTDVLADALQSVSSMTDVVAAVVTPAGAEMGHRETAAQLMAVLGHMGMILISGEDPSDLGQRAARLAGWVRHARGHESGGGAEHHHHHH